jgi:hypothetical protein
MEKAEIICNIKRILTYAMNGNLNLTQFYELWPEEVNNNPWFKCLYDDLEDAITHMPGKFFKKGIDYDAWLGTYDYYRLLTDYLLLNYPEKKEEKLLACRKHLLDMAIKSREQIEVEINNYFQKDNQ